MGRFPKHQNINAYAKCAAWLTLAAINLFFIYYTIILCYSRGAQFQLYFMVAYCYQLLMDIAVYITAECLCIHYFIPMSITKQMSHVVKVLDDAVIKCCSDEMIVSNNSLFNAADYLFVSANLAKSFPDLIG